MKVNWYFNLWRIATLIVGIALLILGIDYYDAPDWDLGVSLLMGTVIYLLMPQFDKYVRGKHKNWLIAACIATVAVDTTYGLYWEWMQNSLASQLINYPASLSLFLMCWLVWCVIPEASLQFLRQRRGARQKVQPTTQANAL